MAMQVITLVPKSGKGQLTVDGIFYALIAIICIYAVLVPFAEITENSLFPLLNNMTYGTQTILLVELIPLFLVVLVIIGLWRGSAKQTDAEYFNR